MGSLVGERAIVVGSGMAGLLAARVLSESYGEVRIIERDRLDSGEAPRRGVPHGRHAHALLARGQQILEELFPGLQAELNEAGVPAGDICSQLRWYFNGRLLHREPANLLSVSAIRPVLEERVRARVRGLPNVDFVDGCVVRGLVASPDASRVLGVETVREGEGGETTTVSADLVLDATGRGSRAPQWLAELGYQRPAEERIRVDLAYTTRLFRLPHDPYGSDLSINPVAWPGNPRGAFFPKLGDGISMLSLTGILGDHPPGDLPGFLEYTRSLPAREIYEAVRDAEPVDDPVTFRFPASVRRRYERLTSLPAGLLVMGDAVCSFNPVYGQGMTVAAQQATVLAEHLRKGGEPRPQQFFREVSKVIDSPWDISAGGDLAFPGVAGPRSLKVRLGNAYMARLQAAAARDSRVTSTFFRVAGLVDPPTELMRPGMVLRVMRGARAAGPPVAGENHTPSGSAGEQRRK